MKTMALTTLLCLSCATLATAKPKIDRTDSSLTITFDNGVVLAYALRAGQFLGLNTATAEGISLKSPQTLVRPLLAQEKGDKPYAMDAIQFREAVPADDGVRILCNVFQTPTDQTFARIFITKDGKPFNDYYLFPILGLPSELGGLKGYQALADKSAPAGAGAGTLEINVTPVTQNIAGFTWKGWKHQYAIKLEGGRTLNCIREIATWETMGEPADITLVALRYRGLGDLAEKLVPLAENAAAGTPAPVKNAFTTTEILPGAVDKAPVVSPAVPGAQNIAGREEGMKYRHGAWIAQPQRGGGANFIDFQYRPTIALASYYEKMESIRSVTEVWPGDTRISYTDCLYFPLASEHATPAKVHLALIPKSPMPENEWHTRYQEMDLFVRDLICKELNFAQHDPLPSLGNNWDSGWEFRINNAIQSVDAWKAAGVKRVIAHHPGWFNGRGLRQKETAFAIPQSMMTDPKKPAEPAVLKNDTGGDCSIHDYIPQSPKVRDLWRTFARKLNDNDMEYMVWITGMVYGAGPVVQKFGTERFSINDPFVKFSSGYPGANGAAGHRNIPFRDPEIRQWWEERMKAAVDDLGVSGFWADSFQNLFMSTMNYQQKDWAPNTRDWWAWIAGQTRRGIAWMGESHAFPGLSCSIECGKVKEGYPGMEWVLPYTTRWYRGEPVPFKGTDQADRVFFRTMANKAPIAPGDGNPSQIPSMKRLSDEYMAALPKMNRPYQLPGDKGVLWLSFDDDKTGILFPFTDGQLPAGVKAQGVVSGAAAGRAEAYKTLALAGDDLLSSFGLLRGDAKDPRIGLKYLPPVRHMKDWSK